MARIMEKYNKELRKQIKDELKLKNIMIVPRLEKIVINSGVGEATRNKKVLDSTMDEITIISGQKPSIRRARKSIASFRLREGMPIGVKVTLRNKRMYEFFDRLITIVIPRMKDFRGLSNRSFDGSGNFTMAIKDQLVFPEIKYDKVDQTRGMSITFVTTARKDSDSLVLLKKLGLPIE